MTESKICTCPSGDGSLRWPCPKHPAVEQAGGDERAADEKPRATRCPDCGEHDLMPGDLCACGYETDPAAGCACPECDGSGDGCVGEVCRECDGSGWFERPEQARAALAQPSPVRSSLLINGYQLRAALDFIAPDGTAEQLKSEACIEWRQQDADFLEAGLYAFCAEYPEEGGVLLDEEPTTAQPSPLQSEQAEAERPEVVARVVHSNPVVLGQCGPLNANDELMTVAQHAASVARWAEMFNRVEQQRDAALARVAELAQALRHLLHNIKASGKRIDLGLAKECAEDALARIDSTVAAQAQHSGPEEFSFEYRHPNGESHTVTVSRDQVINEMPDFLFEALCSKFCNCEPAGETNVVECCCDEYAEEFKLLAAAPAQAQHSVPELLEWAVDRWHAEVSLRPLINVHRRALDDTWRQVIRHLGGDTGLLCGPSHDELLAAAPGKEGV
ncbi:hypothetical protein ABZR47_05550 [Pseudomonas aeruginosa]|nr:hypothetical protein [Pseudomonas aeruginosa]